MKKKEWRECGHRLLIPVEDSFAVMDKDKELVYIIGGYDSNDDETKHNWRIKVTELIGV